MVPTTRSCPGNSLWLVVLLGVTLWYRRILVTLPGCLVTPRELAPVSDCNHGTLPRNRVLHDHANYITHSPRKQEKAKTRCLSTHDGHMSLRNALTADQSALTVDRSINRYERIVPFTVPTVQRLVYHNNQRGIDVVDEWICPAPRQIQTEYLRPSETHGYFDQRSHAAVKMLWIDQMIDRLLL